MIDYSKDIELKRDVDTNQIISYMGSKFIENKGHVNIVVADERFFVKNFRYIVKTAFNSLPDAINAETNVLKLAKQYEDAFIKGIPVGGLTDSDINIIKQNAKAELLSNLNNLLETNENSIAALKQKIEDLQESITAKNQIISDWEQQQQRWSAIEELYTTNIMKNEQNIDQLERINASLIEEQTLTLDTIRENLIRQDEFVSSSMSNFEEHIFNQIDNISETLERASNLGDVKDLINEFNINYKNPKVRDELFNRASAQFNNTSGAAGTDGAAGTGG